MSRGENRHKATRRRTHARGSARNYLGQRTDWREAFIENEIQPLGEATAAELERRLRADGLDVTVTFEATNAHDTPDEVRASGWIAPSELGGTDG